MPTTRRDLLKSGTLAATSSVLPSLAMASAPAAAIPKTAKPLRILILGGKVEMERRDFRR